MTTAYDEYFAEMERSPLFAELMRLGASAAATTLVNSGHGKPHEVPEATPELVSRVGTVLNSALTPAAAIDRITG